MIKFAVFQLFCLLGMTSAYRLLEYSGTGCSGVQQRVLRVAGPSACTKLDTGVAESALVKVDNVSDNQYEVVFYIGDNCDGDMVNSVQNTNACVDIFNKFNPERSPGSIKVIPSASARRAHINALTVQNNDAEMEFIDHTSEIYYTPIAPGVFVPVDSTKIDKDGTFIDEDGFINDFYPLGEDLGDYDGELSDFFGTPNITDLQNRDLLPAMCQMLDTCLETVETLSGYNVIKWANATYRRFKNVPWRKLYKGASFVVDNLANGATLYSTFKSSGNINSSCDSEAGTGAVARDDMKAALNQGSSYTNAVLENCAQDEACFGFAVYLYEKNKPNTGDCK